MNFVSGKLPTKVLLRSPPQWHLFDPSLTDAAASSVASPLVLRLCFCWTFLGGSSTPTFIGPADFLPQLFFRFLNRSPFFSDKLSPSLGKVLDDSLHRHSHSNLGHIMCSYRCQAFIFPTFRIEGCSSLFPFFSVFAIPRPGFSWRKRRPFPVSLAHAPVHSTTLSPDSTFFHPFSALCERSIVFRYSGSKPGVSQVDFRVDHSRSWYYPHPTSNLQKRPSFPPRFFFPHSSYVPWL